MTDELINPSKASLQTSWNNLNASFQLLRDEASHFCIPETKIGSHEFAFLACLAAMASDLDSVGRCLHQLDLLLINSSVNPDAERWPELRKELEQALHATVTNLDRYVALQGSAPVVSHGPNLRFPVLAKDGSTQDIQEGGGAYQDYEDGQIRKYDGNRRRSQKQRALRKSQFNTSRLNHTDRLRLLETIAPTSSINTGTLWQASTHPAHRTLGPDFPLDLAHYTWSEDILGPPPPIRGPHKRMLDPNKPALRYPPEYLGQDYRDDGPEITPDEARDAHGRPPSEAQATWSEDDQSARKVAVDYWVETGKSMTGTGSELTDIPKIQD